MNSKNDTKKWPVRGLERRCPGFSGKDMSCAVRRQVDLEEWSVRIDPDEKGEAERWFIGGGDFDYRLSMPFCIQSIEELASDYPPSSYRANSYVGTAWCRTRCDVPQGWDDGRIWLKIGGVMVRGHVWFNGYYVGFHGKPLVSVKWDVTDFARAGSENVITVELVEECVELGHGIRSNKLEWQGLYRFAELEYTSDVWIDDVYVQADIESGKAVLKTTVDSAGEAEDTAVTVEAKIKDGEGKTVSETKSGDVSIGDEYRTVELECDMGDFRYWSVDDPYLYKAEVTVIRGGQTVDGLSQRFGMREFRVNGNVLELNRRRILFRAFGDDPHASVIPYLTPTRDKELVRRRIRMAKELGFNGIRNHTHPYTPEELEVCDEEGFLVHNEVSVISNFNMVQPYPASREQWREHILETRSHASMVVYCMGNEGAQIVGRDKELQRRADEYYRIAKELAPDRTVIYASGAQGEHPFMPNDFETPHLWGRFFKQSYEGMTRIPWESLKEPGGEKPCVLHEYGKMTVWPDRREQELLKGYPYKADFADMGLAALKEQGLEGLCDELVEKTRKYAGQLQKIMVEMPRRYDYVDGWHLWCLFRNGFRNHGIVDDLATKSDVDPAVFRQSNGVDALMIDRDFAGRTLFGGQTLNIGVYLSLFSRDKLSDGVLSWRWKVDGKVVCEDKVEGLSFDGCRNGKLCDLSIDVPCCDKAVKAILEVDLDMGAGEKITNNWDFWVFNQHDMDRFQNGIAVVGDAEFQKRFRQFVPYAGTFGDMTVTKFGLNGIGRQVSAKRLRDLSVEVVVSDYFDDEIRRYAEEGGTVLLIGSDRLPERMRAEDDDPRAKAIGHNIYECMTPFRTGWDHGNVIALVRDHPIVNDIPNDGYCDLQFFDALHGQPPLRLKSFPGQSKPVLHSIAMMRGEGKNQFQGKVVDSQAYIVESKVGEGRVLGYAVNLAPRPIAMELLNNTLEYLLGERTRV